MAFTLRIGGSLMSMMIALLVKTMAKAKMQTQAARTGITTGVLPERERAARRAQDMGTGTEEPLGSVNPAVHRATAGQARTRTPIRGSS